MTAPRPQELRRCTSQQAREASVVTVEAARVLADERSSAESRWQALKVRGRRQRRDWMCCCDNLGCLAVHQQ